ncbi:MAG: hypothetical protein SO442_05425 [Prevotella sp.]|nr:hypothetical protein [Prevotella sp.]MDY4626031.1 hypothetical protein [Prevotella sp.]MDY5258801.1 hypothetical protein [Prevotella sp.]
MYGACGRTNERPYGLWDDWCEAGTRRGHYNWRWFGADAPRSVPTGLWDDWCEAGTRHGHYNWGWFGADAPTSVPAG